MLAMLHGLSHRNFGRIRNTFSRTVGGTWKKNEEDILMITYVVEEESRINITSHVEDISTN